MGQGGRSRAPPLRVGCRLGVVGTGVPVCSRLVTFYLQYLCRCLFLHQHDRVRCYHSCTSNLVAGSLAENYFLFVYSLSYKKQCFAGLPERMSRKSGWPPRLPARSVCNFSFGLMLNISSEFRACEIFPPLPQACRPD